MTRSRAAVFVVGALVAVGLQSTAGLGGARASIPTEVRPLAGLHNDGGRLADDLGRTVVLRGINAVDKTGWRGALAAPIVNDALIDQVRATGFNHLRLGTTWASIAHDRDSFDDAYIDQLLDTLDALHAKGVVAVIDVHQDVWSAGVGGNGAPAWADPQCNRAPSVPLASTTGTWFAQYGSPDQNVAWANFWNDGYGPADLHCTGAIQTDFVAMWRHLASRVGGHPAVVGYDLLNEPWPSAPPGVFEEVQLFPMYRRVSAAIREVDTATPIFFGPALYSPAVPTAALAAPDPNSVFAPHIYTETMFSGGQVTTGARTDELALRKDIEEAHRFGVPMWVGEWGEVIDPDYTRQMYDLFDRYATSSAFWRLAQYPGENRLAGNEDAHVRPYPEAYPGSATWSYDAAGNTLEMRVTVTDTNPAPVQLVVPAQLSLSTTTPDVTLHPEQHRAVWVLPGPGTFTLTLS